MATVDRVETSSRTHRGRARSSTPSIVGDAPRSVEDVVRIARTTRRRIERELNDRPAVVLAAVAGASFVAGAAVGSRVGRILLSALIPFGLQQLLVSGVAPRIAAYVGQIMSEGAGANGAGSASRAS